MTQLSPFHLAIPVHDLAAARAFYGDLMGCEEGRSASHWVDFNFFGHQLVCHLDTEKEAGPAVHSAVDHDQVPVPHFGMVLNMADWSALAEKLQDLDTQFVIEPRIRFKGEIGEQATMFLADPSGNALEFKAFVDPSRIFANDAV